MLSHAGQLKLEKLKTTLIACGFRALDLLESKSLASGEPWACLAIIGYLFDDAFPAATARFLSKYPWFVKESDDRSFTRQLWKLLAHEQRAPGAVALAGGRYPALTVEQFFQPRFSDLKLALILDVHEVLKNAAVKNSAAARSSRTKPPQPEPAPPVPHPHPMVSVASTPSAAAVSRLSDVSCCVTDVTDGSLSMLSSLTPASTPSPCRHGHRSPAVSVSPGRPVAARPGAECRAALFKPITRAARSP